MNFHGGGGYARYLESHTHLDETADREGFLAVYPNGTGKWRNRLLTFNAGSCCGYALDHHVDDGGFTLACSTSRAPAARRSTGGACTRPAFRTASMMAYRLAAEASDTQRRPSPDRGRDGAEPFAPAHAMPIIHFNSLDDPRALYRGGLGPAVPLTKRH